MAGDRFVFDSFALIGYLEDEAFADRIEALLKKARAKKIRIYLHAIHLGEVLYITLREQGENMANLVYSRVIRFPLEYIDRIDENLLLTASGLKATYPISYADSFAAALAKIKGGILLSGDPEFGRLERDGIIQIEWLR